MSRERTAANSGLYASVEGGDQSESCDGRQKRNWSSRNPQNFPSEANMRAQVSSVSPPLRSDSNCRPWSTSISCPGGSRPGTYVVEAPTYRRAYRFFIPIWKKKRGWGAMSRYIGARFSRSRLPRRDDWPPNSAWTVAAERHPAFKKKAAIGPR